MNFSRENVAKEVKKASEGVHSRLRHMASWLTRIAIILFIVAACGAVSIGFGALKGVFSTAPDLSHVSVAPVGYSSSLIDKDGKVMRTLYQAGSNRKAVTYDRIPLDLANAFIAIEDERFRSHNGIDIKGIVRAAFIGLKNRHFSEGASTITQQLIKNNVLGGGSEKSFGDRLRRKIEEQYLALKLEQAMGKNDILLNYLNTINLGSNTLGVEAASNRYFDKSVQDLTLSECAVIAAITQNPSRYNPITHPDNNAARRKTVLKRMLDQGLISRNRYDEALADPVYDRIAQVTASRIAATPYTYFEDAVIEAVVSDLETELGYTRTQAYNYLYSGGLVVETTFDPALQAIVDEEINKEENYPFTQYSYSYSLTVTDRAGTAFTYTDADLRAFYPDYTGDPEAFLPLITDTKEAVETVTAAYKESLIAQGFTVESEMLQFTLQPQASFVLLDNATGQVRAISGGRGVKNTSLSLNRAIDSTRQPGSTFKPLSDYAPAIDLYNCTLATTFYDAPFSVNGKEIHNSWGDKYVGYANIRHGIAFSMNVMAVKCMTQIVTPTVGFQYLKDLGITTLVEGRRTATGYYTDVIPVLCLGGITDGVTNLELTAAYATIANRGVYNEPTFYTRVTDHDGKVILEKKPESHRVMRETTAMLLTYAMEDSFRAGPSPWFDYTDQQLAYFCGYPCNIPVQAAGKSGSTTSYNDLWFEGFTPYYTAGIWSGYDAGASFGHGRDFHKSLWARIMERVHEGYDYADFAPCADIVECQICSLSGKLAVDGVCGCGDDPGYVYTEYFAAGTEPTETCDRHVKVRICADTHQAAGEYCPEDGVEEHIYVVVDEADLQACNYAETALTAYLLPENLRQTCVLHTQAPETEPASEETETGSGTEAETDVP